MSRKATTSEGPGPERPAPRAAPAGNDTGYRVGQSVTHAKFGSGIIIDFEGRGPDARVQVKFRDAGTKWLALAYARLSTA